MGKNLGSQHK
jgi:hypothetical protein